jgi:phytoene/squalene synthetase
MYNLRDFGEDIIADLINIPKQELERFEISDEDLQQVRSA